MEPKPSDHTLQVVPLTWAIFVNKLTLHDPNLTVLSVSRWDPVWHKVTQKGCRDIEGVYTGTTGDGSGVSEVWIEETPDGMTKARAHQLQ